MLLLPLSHTTDIEHSCPSACGLCPTTLVVLFFSPPTMSPTSKAEYGNTVNKTPLMLEAFWYFTVSLHANNSPNRSDYRKIVTKKRESRRDLGNSYLVLSNLHSSTLFWI